MTILQRTYLVDGVTNHRVLRIKLIMFLAHMILILRISASVYITVIRLVLNHHYCFRLPYHRLAIHFTLPPPQVMRQRHSGAADMVRLTVRVGDIHGEVDRVIRGIE